MGGMNSGTWARPSRKTTVEECFAISIDNLSKSGAIEAGASGIYSWHDKETNEVVSAVNYSSQKIDYDNCLKISFYKESTESIYWIYLQETNPHFGGTRYWFTCDCGRRVGKLYLVQGVIGCRTCHDLTYTSCQENHQVERLMKQAAKLSGNRSMEYLEPMFDRIGQYVEMDASS